MRLNDINWGIGKLVGTWRTIKWNYTPKISYAIYMTVSFEIGYLSCILTLSFPVWFKVRSWPLQVKGQIEGGGQIIKINNQIEWIQKHQLYLAPLKRGKVRLLEWRLSLLRMIRLSWWGRGVPDCSNVSTFSIIFR